MRVELARWAFTPFGVFGELSVGGFSCFTVERPWLDNEPFRSCIPAGEYRLVRGFYHRGGYPAFEVRDVPGRSLIKIHAGNTMDDVVGCIAPGMGLGWLDGKWAVIRSRLALTTFMDVLPDSEASLVISTRLPTGD